jgi:hypothetical protein
MTNPKRGIEQMIQISKFIQYQLANDDFGNLIILPALAYDQIRYFVYQV